MPTGATRGPVPCAVPPKAAQPSTAQQPCPAPPPQPGTAPSAPALAHGKVRPMALHAQPPPANPPAPLRGPGVSPINWDVWTEVSAVS